MSEIDGDKFETKWVYYQNQKFLVKNNNPFKKTVQQPEERGSEELAGQNKEKVSKGEIADTETLENLEENKEIATEEKIEETGKVQVRKEKIPETKPKSVFECLERMYGIYQKHKGKK